MKIAKLKIENYFLNTRSLSPVKLKIKAMAEPTTAPKLAQPLTLTPHRGPEKVTHEAIPTFTTEVATIVAINLKNSDLPRPLLPAPNTQNLFQK